MRLTGYQRYTTAERKLIRLLHGDGGGGGCRQLPGLQCAVACCLVNVVYVCEALSEALCVCVLLSYCISAVHLPGDASWQRPISNGAAYGAANNHAAG